LGPLALGSLRDAFGSYSVGWAVALLMAVVLAATAIGIPARADRSARAGSSD
jgi:cyanate permease